MNKNVRPMLLFGLALICLTVLASAALAAGRAGSGAAVKGKVVRTLDANAWTIKTTNYGPIVYPEGSSSGGCWG
ncbi:hypothetical protein EG831_02720, partial [bacterium]|nr:hypothetical protein [bacterium]